MTSKAFFGTLAKRKDSRHSARKARTTTKCPKTTGDVLIGVFQLPGFDPLPGTPIDIPGLGEQTTDGDGVASWLEQDPGAYAYAVQTADTDHEDGLWQDEAKGFTLAKASVALFFAGVQPAGALHVKVVKRSDGTTLPAADVLSIGGVDAPVEGAADHTFDRIKTGWYDVVAKLKKDAYTPEIAKAEAIEVKANETAELVIEVDPLTWVAVKVRDVRAKRDLPKCVVEFSFAGEDPALASTAEDAPARVAKADTGAACSLTAITPPEDEIYELYEIV